MKRFEVVDSLRGGLVVIVALPLVVVGRAEKNSEKSRRKRGGRVLWDSTLCSSS